MLAGREAEKAANSVPLPAIAKSAEYPALLQDLPAYDSVGRSLEEALLRQAESYWPFFCVTILSNLENSDYRGKIHSLALLLFAELLEEDCLFGR